MAKLYTRSGDDGYTGRLGSGRLPKDHPIIEALGAVDEASAAMGIARAASQDPRTKEVLLAVQRDLYALMTEISASEDTTARFKKIDNGRVAWLEARIDDISNEITLPKEFIVPGDSLAGAALALARAIVRKAERRIVGLFHDHELSNPDLLHYINRLSSLLFTLELLENKAGGVDQSTLAKTDR